VKGTDKGRRSQGGIRVLIVDDHKLFAEAIRWSLERRGMDVVGLAGTAAEALTNVEHWKPEVVLVDLGLPGEDGLSLGRKILKRHPGTKVLAVTALTDPQTIAETVREGFHGYLTKDAPVSQLVSSVQAALNGHVVLPERVAAVVEGRPRAEQEATLLAQQLTDRERQLLTLLVEGRNNKEIAASLAISPNTVRTHVQSILTKLQVHSRLEAATYAVRYGLVKVRGKRQRS
jgi:two-component system nitrate/nitrite response regulator NarL